MLCALILVLYPFGMSTGDMLLRPDSITMNNTMANRFKDYWNNLYVSLFNKNVENLVLIILKMHSPPIYLEVTASVL